MRRVVILVLSVAALTGFFAFDDARHGLSNASQSRCAAYAAADMDCPYGQ
jgi:hypothetical protein